MYNVKYITYILILNKAHMHMQPHTRALKMGEKSAWIQLLIAHMVTKGCVC